MFFVIASPKECKSVVAVAVACIFASNFANVNNALAHKENDIESFSFLFMMKK
jgi:hypothetical protein